MENSKISKAASENAEQAILDGNAEQLAAFLSKYYGDPFLQRWKEALKAHAVKGTDVNENARAIIAYTHHFNSWTEFEAFKQEACIAHTETAQFEKAVDAVIEGDISTLNKLLSKNPALIYSRSQRNHHATLLHYVGANGVENFRQKTPLNAVEVAITLLNAGAEIDARGDMYRGTTTLGLVATSVHPVKAGVQQDLIDILLKYGADINCAVAPDYTEGNLVVACLHNGRGEAAVYLANKGAPLNLEGALGTGMLKEVKKYYDTNGNLKDETNVAKRDAGLMWACEYGHIKIIDLMLDKGFDLSTVNEGMTALHWAAIGRQVETTKMLLEHHAPLEIVNGYGGTVLSQALWSAYNDPKPQDPLIIETLIKAGARIEPGWDKYINEIKSWYRS